MLLQKQPQLSPGSSFKAFKLVFEAEKNCIKEYETFLNGIFGLQFTNKQEAVFTFGIISEHSQTTFYVIIPEEYIVIFKKKYSAINPYIQFDPIDDPLLTLRSEKQDNEFLCGYDMKLMYKEQDKRLKVGDLDRKFMANLLGSMNNIETGDCSVLEISIQSNRTPVPQQIQKQSRWAKYLYTATDLTVKGLCYALDATLTKGLTDVYKSDNPQKVKLRIDNPRNSMLILKTNIRLISKSDDEKSVMDNVNCMASVFADYSDANSLIPLPLEDDLTKRSLDNANQLSTTEISQFLHLPDKNIRLENFKTSNCRKLYDKDVAQQGIFFGTSNNFPVSFPCVPLSVEKYKEMYNEIKGFPSMMDNLVKAILVLGQQGTGKSSWVINYIISLIKMGISIIAVDPKNDTQQGLIECIPQEFMHKVDYLNFGDTEFPPAMNIFRKRNQDDFTENSLIVTSFIALMKKEFSKNWGFKIQRTLQMTAETILITHEQPTLNEFELMLTDRDYREAMIKKMEDMLDEEETKSKGHIKKLVRFWKVFNTPDEKIIQKEIEPVMNQLGVFMSNRIIRSIVSQKETYDFRKAADEGRIVIINVPEGVLHENTRLLASMINKAIWIDIQGRANVDISDRYPVAWIIDESHQIVDEEFVGVLTMARAYRLGVTLITQVLSNYKIKGMDDIKDLIVNNCKKKIVFRVGLDTRDLIEEFDPLSSIDLQNCPDYHFYGKILLENGSVSNPFFASAPAPAKKLRDYDAYLKKHQSGKFTVDQIEDELEDRLEAIKVAKKLRGL